MAASCFARNWINQLILYIEIRSRIQMRFPFLFRFYPCDCVVETQSVLFSENNLSNSGLFHENQTGFCRKGVDNSPNREGFLLSLPNHLHHAPVHIDSWCLFVRKIFLLFLKKKSMVDTRERRRILSKDFSVLIGFVDRKQLR